LRQRIRIRKLQSRLCSAASKVDRSTIQEVKSTRDGTSSGPIVIKIGIHIRRGHNGLAKWSRVVFGNFLRYVTIYGVHPIVFW